MYVRMYVCIFPSLCVVIAVSFARPILDEAYQPTLILQDLIISQALNRVRWTAIKIYSF